MAWPAVDPDPAAALAMLLQTVGLNTKTAPRPRAALKTTGGEAETAGPSLGVEHPVQIQMTLEAE